MLEENVNNMTNKLPKYWVVKNDGSQLFKDTVIKYLNCLSSGWNGSNETWYYGYDGNPKDNGTANHFDLNFYLHRPTVLTVQEFIDLTTEWTPKRGELVEVSDRGDSWLRRIYLATIEGAKFHIQTVVYNSIHGYNLNHPFDIMRWKRIRRIEEPKPELKISITLNGKAVDPSTMSEETWNNLRLQSNPTC